MVFFHFELVLKVSAWKLEIMHQFNVLLPSSPPLCCSSVGCCCRVLTRFSKRLLFSKNIHINQPPPRTSNAQLEHAGKIWRGAAGRVGSTGRRPGYQTFYISSLTFEAWPLKINRVKDAWKRNEESDTHKDVQRSGGNSDISTPRRHICGFRRRAERIHRATSSKGEKVHVSHGLCWTRFVGSYGLMFLAKHVIFIKSVIHGLKHL